MFTTVTFTNNVTFRYKDLYVFHLKVRHPPPHTHAINTHKISGKKLLGEVKVKFSVRSSIYNASWQMWTKRHSTADISSTCSRCVSTVAILNPLLRHVTVNTHARHKTNGIPHAQTNTAAPVSRTLTFYIALKHWKVLQRECTTLERKYCLESLSENSAAQEREGVGLPSNIEGLKWNDIGDCRCWNPQINFAVFISEHQLLKFMNTPTNALYYNKTTYFNKILIYFVSL